MSELFEFLELYAGASSIVKDMIFLYLLVTIWQYFELVEDKKKESFSNTLDFVDICISNIKREAKANVEKLLLADGIMCQEDQKELDRYLDRMTLGFFEVKDKQKKYLRSNGYYRLYVDRDQHRIDANRKKLENLYVARGTEMRNIINDYVEPCFRPDSILNGLAEKRFSTEKAIDIYKSIISRHIDEIRVEERDINNFLLWRVPFLRLVMKYKHKDLKVR